MANSLTRQGFCIKHGRAPKAPKKDRTPWLDHLGHHLSVVCYGTVSTLECDDCHLVLAIEEA